MKIDVFQKRLSLHYKYEILKDGILSYTARANRTVWPLFRRIKLRNASGEEIASLVQRSIPSRIAEKISPYGCPYVLSQQDRTLGWIREWFKLGQPCAKALLEGSSFSTYGHSGNTYSIYRESVQIGQIEREAWKGWDGDRMHAEFDYDADPLISVMHVLFADITWHTDDLELSSLSYEQTITFDGVQRDPDWKPKEKAAERGER